jgi:FdhD protein
MEREATRPGASTEARVVTIEDRVSSVRYDRLATEEPLEIRLRAGRERRTLAITMRTPGHDFELAAGFLFAEGVIRDVREIRTISYCLDGELDAAQQYNVVNVDLAARELPPLESLERHFTTTSACGICGRAGLEALRDRGFAPIESGARVGVETLYALPERLRAAQGIFARTGGLHAAGFFTLDGSPVAVREDVGRHNAFDKLVGWALLERRLPLDGIVGVSGRASYELLQKAVVARAPIFCAVSAPSSLAVEMARNFNVTLVGFLRERRFNVYSGEARIDSAAAAAP